MDSTITSRATRSKSTSTTCAASSVRASSPTSRDAATVSKTPASSQRPWSLRRRMAIAAAGAACVVFVLLGLLVFRAVAATTAVQFDELLQQQASLALHYADHEYGEGDTVVPAALAAAPLARPFDMLYQIGTRTGQVLYRSPGAPATPLTSGEGPGCSDVALSGRSWRACSLGSRSTPLVIHLAEPLDYRAALLSRTMRAVALPLSFALVLLTALIGLVTERAFRPVRRIAADLAERSDDDLSPVNTAEMPVETHRLGVALNGLLARQAEVLARERRFTADAAHELRTPLAALRVQAQVAARATTAAETRSALEDLAPVARDRQVEISLAGCEQQVPGSPEVLYPLLRNLLENSIRNVSARGRVALEVASGDQCAVLTISDDGPGIPPAERNRAFERFCRIPGSATGGSGLGLSIVGRIVELLFGKIELAAPATGSGLVVTVTLPFSANPQAQSAA